MSLSQQTQTVSENHKQTLPYVDTRDWSIQDYAARRCASGAPVHEVNLSCTLSYLDALVMLLLVSPRVGKPATSWS